MTDRRHPRRPQRHSREVEVWDYDAPLRTVRGTAVERNGNLTYVEREDGRAGWYAPFELN